MQPLQPAAVACSPRMVHAMTPKAGRQAGQPAAGSSRQVWCGVAWRALDGPSGSHGDGGAGVAAHAARRPCQRRTAFHADAPSELLACRCNSCASASVSFCSACASRGSTHTRGLLARRLMYGATAAAHTYSA